MVLLQLYQERDKEHDTSRGSLESHRYPCRTSADPLVYRTTLTTRTGSSGGLHPQLYPRHRRRLFLEFPEDPGPQGHTESSTERPARLLPHDHEYEVGAREHLVSLIARYGPWTGGKSYQPWQQPSVTPSWRHGGREHPCCTLATPNHRCLVWCFGLDEQVGPGEQILGFQAFRELRTAEGDYAVLRALAPCPYPGRTASLLDTRLLCVLLCSLSLGQVFCNPHATSSTIE